MLKKSNNIFSSKISASKISTIKRYVDGCGSRDCGCGSLIDYTFWCNRNRNRVQQEKESTGTSKFSSSHL